MSNVLYQWFDDKTRANLPEVARIGCCQQIVHALGTLAGLGIPRDTLSGFAEATLDGIEKMMTAVVPGASFAKNVEAVLDQAEAVNREQDREQALGSRLWEGSGSGTQSPEPRALPPRGLVLICRRCQPPTGVEEKTIGILRGFCEACGAERTGPELAAFSLRDVLHRLSFLEERRRAEESP